VALSLLVATAALDPDCRLTLLDGKLVELAVWRSCAHRNVGVSVKESAEFLAEGVDPSSHAQAATIDAAARGIGFLLHEGGVPVRLRSYLLSDGDIDALADRAEHLRAANWSESRA
jgi:hypothetical protein